MIFYGQLYGVDCRIARLANLYATVQNISEDQGVASILIDRIINAHTIHVWSNGETIRDHLHIDDVVFGLVATVRAQAVKTSYIFNLGSGRELFVNALISQPSLLAGRRTKVINDPARKFDIPFEALKISSARAELGWHPQVDLSEGLSRTFGLLSMYY